MDCRLIYGVTLVIGLLTLAVNGLKISSSAPVGPLTMPITRDYCGQSKVCFETPENCDPSSNDTCLFVSAVATSNNDAGIFELRGDSESYIVLILSPDMTQGNDNAFICANYNGTNLFFSATFDNGSLTVTNKTKARHVLAAYETNVVRCTFMIRQANRKTTDRYIHEPPFFIFAGNGSITNGVLGDPAIMLASNSRVALFYSSSDMTFTDIPVGDLATPITRNGCGRTKYCNEVPADCDPRGTGKCLFISAVTSATPKRSGTKVNFEMRGNSTGYIAIILSTDLTPGGNDTTFICAQNNNTIRFLTATLDNGRLTRTNESEKIKKVLASLTENVIRCTFSAQELNSTTNAKRVTNDTTFAVFAATGAFRNEMLGMPNILLMSNGTVNLADFSSSGGAGLHPASLALLVLLSLLISRLV